MTIGVLGRVDAAAHPVPVNATNANEEPRAWPRHILACTHGGVLADSALRAAEVIAARTGATVELLAVATTCVPIPGPLAAEHKYQTTDRAHAATLLHAVHQQRARLGGAVRHWGVRLEIGDPAATVVRVAAECGTDLVIVGIGRPGGPERQRGGLTGLLAALSLSVPLLAVMPNAKDPASGMVVFPHGDPHAETLRAAEAYLVPDGTLYIAAPRGAAMLSSGADKRIPVPLDGDVCAAALAAAAQHGVDFIAVPIHGMPGPVRRFLPNLFEALLLGADCSVLAVPDPA